MNTQNFFALVQEDLLEVESLMRCQGEDCHSDLKAALDHILSAGGKRIRPTLVLLTGGMLEAPHDKLITLGAAVELLHTATLVHDDLIDGALLRRGIQTLNSQWSSPATVLTGDFLFARAAKLAAETNHLPLMKYFAETLAIIVNGELTQLFTSRWIPDRQDYEKRIYAKTGSLIEMTTRAAAMISPVDEGVVETMRGFGYNLGIAFQIVDDVLDFTGEQQEVGKPVGSDLMQGLITLPALYYIEDHPKDPGVLALLEGRALLEREKIETLAQAIRASDAPDKALQECKDFVKKAVESLEAFPPGNERQALTDLAEYIVDRKN